jgi:DNA transformation protein
MDATALEDLFAPVGKVTCRRMFSGHGIYVGTACFAIAARGGLWIKADAALAEALAAAGSTPFSMTREDGKVVAMRSFWSLPAAALDDADELLRWCQPALAVAREASAAKVAALETMRRRATGSA